MTMPVKYLVMALSLAIAALWLHGSHLLTLAIDLGLIATALAALVWLDPRCVEVEFREVSPKRNTPRASTRYRWWESRCKAFGLTLVIIYGAFLTQYGTVEGYFQHQRFARTNAHIERLMAAGQFQQAADYIETWLRHGGSATGRTDLQFKLLDCWLKLADEGEVSQRAAILAKAEALVQEGIIDRQLLLHLRRHFDHAAAMKTQRAELIHAKRSAADELAQERELRKATEALAADQHGRLKREHASHHFSTLIAWADSLSTNLPAQHLKYGEAIEFGRTWQLDVQVPEQRRRGVAAAIRLLQPSNLPPGVIVNWLSLHTDRHPPALEAELSIQDAAGQPLAGLTAKDFQVHIAGRLAHPLGVGYVTPARQRLSMVLLIDRSGSTAGPPLEAAKAGIHQLLNELAGHADVCLVAFNGAVTPLTPWISDSGSVASRLATLQAGGATAIYDALAAAEVLLRGRSGPRLIVLFSDGKDSTNVSPEAVLSRLRAEQIFVHAVGLETSEFDRPAIERLTTSTGGTLTTAAQASELSQRFAQLSHALHAPRYRLVIPCQEASGLVRIQVGQQNAVILERTIESNTRLPLAKQ